MDSALGAGGRGPFRGQDAPCARRDYFIRIQRFGAAFEIRTSVRGSRAKAPIFISDLDSALKGRLHGSAEASPDRGRLYCETISSFA